LLATAVIVDMVAAEMAAAASEAAREIFLRGDVQNISDWYSSCVV